MGELETGDWCEADPGRSRERENVAPPGAVGGSEVSWVREDRRNLPGLRGDRQARVPGRGSNVLTQGAVGREAVMGWSPAEESLL